MWLKRGLSAIIFIGLGIQSLIGVAHAESSYSIFLVRHAEKNTLEFPNTKNPPLTQCGLKRAQRLTEILQDSSIDAVYSTDYLRTQQTAEPTATKRGLKVLSYDPRDLDGFAAQLKQKGQSALVVGHSNTTGILASLLLDSTASKQGVDIDESEFDLLLITTLVEGKGSLLTLRQGFSCNSPN